MLQQNSLMSECTSYVVPEKVRICYVFEFFRTKYIMLQLRYFFFSKGNWKTLWTMSSWFRSVSELPFLIFNSISNVPSSSIFFVSVIILNCSFSRQVSHIQALCTGVESKHGQLLSNWQSSIEIKFL